MVGKVEDNGVVYLTMHRRNVKLAYTINGDVKFKSSVGKTKYKNTRKTSAICFQETTNIFISYLKAANISNIQCINIKGVSFNLDVVVKTLAQQMTIHSINNITPYRHGGCKPKRQVRK